MKNSLTPDCIKNVITTKNNPIRVLRSNTNQVIKFTKINKPHVNLIKLWNELDLTLKQAKRNKFITQINKDIISNYNAIPDCRLKNCHSCTK